MSIHIKINDILNGLYYLLRINAYSSKFYGFIQKHLTKHNNYPCCVVQVNAGTQRMRED